MWTSLSSNRHMPETVPRYGRDSSVGIATCYRLYGPGIESRWGRNFPHPVRPVLGPIQPPMQWVPVFSPGVKRPRRGVDHPNYLAPRSKKDSHNGPSWPVLAWTLPLLYLFPVRQSSGTQQLIIHLQQAQSYWYTGRFTLLHLQAFATWWRRTYFDDNL